MKSLSRPAILATLAAAVCAGSSAAAPAADGKGAAATLVVLKDVCLPLLGGAKIDTVAKATGLKNGRDGWVLPIRGKRRIEVDPPGGSNPHVCSATIIHDPNAGGAIVDAITAWSNSQTPVLQPLKAREKTTGAIYQLTTSSWVGKAPGGDLAIVYTEDKTLKGQPVAGNLDQASLTVGLTPSRS